MTDVSVKPLFEDPSASPELRNFVVLARSDGPSQADLDRLASRIAPAVGLSASVMLAGTAVKVALGTPPAELVLAPGVAGKQLGLLGKLFASGSAKLMAVGLSAGIGVAIWIYSGSERPAAGGRDQAVRSAPLAAEPSGSGGAVSERLPMAPAREPASAGTSAAPSPEVELPGGGVAPPAALPGAPDAVQSAPSRGGSVAAARSASGRAVRRRAGGARVAGAVKPAPREQAPPSVPAFERPSELSLIQQAEAARGHPADALALLATHARLYPRGALAQEREVLAIELLLKSGSLAQASARAARFEGDHPRSAHLPRVRALIERAGAE